MSPKEKMEAAREIISGLKRLIAGSKLRDGQYTYTCDLTLVGGDLTMSNGKIKRANSQAILN